MVGRELIALESLRIPTLASILQCSLHVNGLLKKEYMDNLGFLVDEIYLLLGDVITKDNLQRAEMSLAKFQLSFQMLYGPKNVDLMFTTLGVI
ncbi:hypothetical protein DPMN_180740 [Dreissena polymorpha]|uniref:Uncharacterized protein n=1 Tax=Dreissena polymorpha TaxID=45954 RepID=A0A9D4I3N1_DREPO|nr:hypothetical protein DPMN_180740 [Dreissena polymorpha]